MENERISLESVIISNSPEIIAYASSHDIPVFKSHDEYRTYAESQNISNNHPQSPSLYDFTRKSVVGAFYRVGASFAIDGAVYLALTGGELKQFCDRFQWDKFLTVTAAVVAINFVDYKFEISNKLDRFARRAIDGVRPFYS